MKKLRVFLLFITLFIIPCSSIWAAFSSDESGTVGASFLKFGAGARSLSMGEAYTAVAGGVDALFWNPANLSRTRSFEYTLTHQPLLEFTDFDVGAGSWSDGKYSLAIGMTRLTHDDLDVLDLSGTKVRSFEAFDQQIIVGASVGKGKWGLGGAVKQVKSKIDNVTADTFAVDIGLSFPGLLNQRFSHGISIQNIGSKLRYDNEKYSLPFLVKFGSQMSLGTRSLVSVDVGFPKDNDPYGAIGTELALVSKDQLRFKLRSGYHTKRRDIGGLSGLGIGGGLELFNLRLDYAWLPYEDFGQSHAMTIIYRFPIPDPIAPAYKYDETELGKYNLDPLK